MEMEISPHNMPKLPKNWLHPPTTFPPPPPDPCGPEPDVLLAPPLPGFDCDHAGAISPLIDDALPNREDSDNGSEILSDDESDFSVNPLHPQSAFRDEISSVLPPPLLSPKNSSITFIPLIHQVPHSGEVDENSLDPFHSLTDTPHCTPYAATHHLAPIRILYLLAIWLHAVHHVSFRVIGAILSVVQLILSAANFYLDPSSVSAISLTTVHSHMSIDPTFQVLPVCPVFQEVYPAHESTPASCIKCACNNVDVPLLEESTDKHGKGAKPKR